MRAGSQRGFTLIEVMVVVFIIGIIVTFASLSISGRVLSDRVETEAQRLQALFAMAGEDAEMHGMEIGFIHTDGGYAFVTTSPEGRWAPITTGPLRPRELKAPITMELRVEGRSVPPTPLAELVAAGKAALKEAEAAKSADKKDDGDRGKDQRDDGKKDDDKDQIALKPQAMFLSSGEATALSVDVSAPGVASVYRLEVDNLGRSKLTALDDQR
ncbi:prepilin-type N-terminal cleavage/methylation domain-containing protein [Solimonas terrae]|uniref:Prepilin-type N-terminal cleavage/methylation domain-containing protein n=1 Tax=Solimonas terrae TaxID=1396819 RepID=A0A6M2BVS1_9GAMM|nr:prepilin-type N-terminal cleavage/methylation domain-containing protein [Solimonas terrae]NGY06311.1 prepilin-type N-terminal cleavage/methylation domain-containing protein [Solimonas terrae]